MRAMDAHVDERHTASPVSCTPIFAMGEPMGPMLNGRTYMVAALHGAAERPRSFCACRREFFSCWWDAALSLGGQMRCGLRRGATSVESEARSSSRARVFRSTYRAVPLANHFGRKAGRILALEPSTQLGFWSGRVSSAIFSTQRSRWSFLAERDCGYGTDSRRWTFVNLQRA